MPQAEIEIQPKNKLKSKINIKVDFHLILMGIFAFLTARTVVFDALSPFALSFLSVNTKNKYKYAYLAVITLIGTLTVRDTSYLTLKYILALMFLIAVQTLTEILSISIHPCFLAPFSLLIVSIPQTVISGYSLYSVLMLMVEVALCCIFVFIMAPITDMLQSTLSRHKTSAEQAICLCVLASFVLLGFYQLDSWGNLSIGNTACAIVILLAARCGNFTTGAVAGILTGFTAGMARFDLASTVGLYGLCGLFCGSLKKYGKLAITFVFIATNLTFTFVTTEASNYIFSAEEQLAALVIFWLIPKKALVRIEDLLHSVLPESHYSVKAREVITNRLVKTSSSFNKLADSLHDLSNWHRDDIGSDITVIYDEAASRVCKKCKNCFNCWQENFNSTYNALLHVSPTLQANGTISTGDLPSYFYKKCIKADEYVDEINKQYNVFRFNSSWQNKINHSKSMVTEQLYGISDIMDNLSSELTQKIEFDTVLEKEIIKALLSKGIVVYDATVIINEKRHYEVTLSLSQCHGCECYDSLAETITSVTGIPMRLNKHECAPNEQKCEFNLVEKETFKVNCSVASRTKNGEVISGDNFGFMQFDNGSFIMAVSDGMGSGNPAAGQSTTTVKLLSKFLDAGFDKTLTLKMINSILLLRSGDEVFATMDIAFIDLFTGKGEFLKLGASPTYIIREHKVLTVNSVSLPAGILDEVNVETTAMLLKNKDCIIMLSDGIESPDKPWVSDFAECVDFDTPKELADMLVEQASLRHSHSDDMTVLVGIIESE